MALLTDEEIEAGLADLPGWERDGDAIAKVFDRGDFKGSVAFVSRMLGPAEAMNHHPDLELSWNEVLVRISTHSEGGVTASDLDLAAQIEQLP